MKKFTMSQAQYDRLIEAMKPVPHMKLTGWQSRQDNANTAWKNLGLELGFKWETVKPDTETKNPLEFYAEEIKVLPDEPEALPPEMANVTEKPFEFRVRDRVRVPWSDKVYSLVENQFSSTQHYPLRLDGVMSEIEGLFTVDGKFSIAHDKPVLTLVERPKKTVKKTYWFVAWVNNGAGVCVSPIFDSESKAKEYKKTKDETIHSFERDELCE